ncbi:MAG: thioesterase [Desulfobacteraceae bacterium]|nr:thioesterase [Desulfobacteraceae bacterium]
MNEPRNPRVPVRLFCLPFAGGSYYSYYPLEKHMDSRVSLFPIDLPGHGRRMREPLLDDLNDMCADLYQQIRDQLNGPYALLGHSMGATLAYLLAQKIRAMGGPRPVHLFAAGRQGPPAPSRQRDVHLLPEQDFIAHLQLYGGIQDDVLMDKELLQLFEPILRADFKALGNYTYKEEPPLAVPVTVFLGTADTTTYDEALTWQAVTRTPIGMHRFPGGHFFLFDHLGDIGSMISGTVLAAAGLFAPRQ